MKYLFLSLVFIASSAQASYYHVKCSNASGSVKWESGHNSNTITYAIYSSGGPRTATVRLSEVKITEGKKFTILKEADAHSRTTVTAGQVSIRSASDAPNPIDLSYNGEIKTEVICESFTSWR